MGRFEDHQAPATGAHLQTPISTGGHLKHLQTPVYVHIYSQVSYAQYKANPCKYLVKFEAGLFLLFMEFSIEFRPESVFSECGTCSFDHAHL